MGNLDSSTKLLGQVERLLEDGRSGLPAETCDVVKSTCTRVRELLKGSETTVQELTGTFGGSRSGLIRVVKSVVQRASRAKSFDVKMSKAEAELNKCSEELRQLINVLTLALKIEETQDIILDTRDAVSVTRDTVLRIEDSNNSTSKPEYRRAVSSTLALHHTVVLNFDEIDADGNPATPEGKLKHSVLSSLCSTQVAAAVGVMKPTHGVVGMGGVGKTIALQGLAYDIDIRDRFIDGILYMSLGQDANVQKVMDEICRIMRITGAHVAESFISLRELIEEAAMWFSGKRCLFLVDDVWPTGNRETGYLQEVQEILRESPDSRMAVSTRSVEIARAAGLIVPFDAREPTESMSKTLFMHYVTVCVPSVSYTEVEAEVESSVGKILLLCGGLPIALAVAGCGVASLAHVHGNFKSACILYAKQLEDKVIDLGEEKIGGCGSLNAGIAPSLECMEANWEDAAETGHSAMELYTSLCVLEKQGWIPVSVLCRMWKVYKGMALKVAKRFGEMNLASFSVREVRNGGIEYGIMLHDLQL